ncbi:restriction endonuclease [Brevibacillus centrosporus]|jgi:restriction system protein|uniref:restriction endonuclease n=1 Tax=Brevibacillus centrosporus TaxID=54910 RepID=UPI0039862D27
MAVPIYKGIDYTDLKSVQIEDIDTMEGTDFEQYLNLLLIELGYPDAYKTGNSRDFGADIVFTDSTGIRNIIQAKRYHPELPVSLDAVQQVYTARNYYQAKKAIVITSATFTDSCETLAGVNGVLLLDRNDLIEIIHSFQQSGYQRATLILEREPRVIYRYWDDPHYVRNINKDKKLAKVAAELIGSKAAN